MRIQSFSAAVLASIAFTISTAGAVPQLDSTYWDSNWDAMFFQNKDGQVASEYIYDQGVISATLHGDTLIGWWREHNNPQSCGPDNKWSGRILFLFAPDGKSFTGSWDNCSDAPTALNPLGSGWTGTLRNGGYTESECLAGGRYWCQGACQLSACGAPLTQTQCLAAGRFWCADACSITQCASSIRPFIRSRGGSAGAAGAGEWDGGVVDLRGRSIDPASLPKRGWLVPDR